MPSPMQSGIFLWCHHSCRSSTSHRLSNWYVFSQHRALAITDAEQLTRIYDDASFKASTAELVIVHMVFATIYFQYGVRNREEPAKHKQLNDFSNNHYHWCLSKFYDLAISQTVT